MLYWTGVQSNRLDKKEPISVRSQFKYPWKTLKNFIGMKKEAKKVTIQLRNVSNMTKKNDEIFFKLPGALKIIRECRTS